MVTLASTYMSNYDTYAAPVEKKKGTRKTEKGKAGTSHSLAATHSLAVRRVIKQVHESRLVLESNQGALLMDPVEFEAIQPPGSTMKVVVGMTNVDPSVQYTLLSYAFLSDVPETAFSVPTTMPMQIRPGTQNLDLVVECTSPHFGVCRDIVSFAFQVDADVDSQFTISRFLAARFGSLETIDMLSPSTGYDRQQYKTKREERSSVWNQHLPSVKVPKQSLEGKLKMFNHTHPYPLPQSWRSMTAVDVSNTLEGLLHCFSLPQGCQDWSHTEEEHARWYKELFRALLFAEEKRQIENLHSYDMSD
ncbi:hypothetical protein SARC_01319 [Sphaeroforma arctica JP610]|uniref:Uncharacterized protein n=1 Tax=Sphaeroforma arctica JP610 TaxID=667725 RepID=A0A0L0GCB7_9EUKA|nr:hypothetical protein SARC_01319 [Sphaeroforma arctica JP610]KNC86546.1 hypothetical protein SARC_01319 [Sphaeroforma arctica JP610]|eukprot:XP_014160448.1 hypothetical protein SARC_01319 [Sphaeroforma arctica JP610]